MSNPSRKPDADRPKGGIFSRPGALIAVIVGIIVALIVANHSKAAVYPDAKTARFNVTVTGSGPDVILIPGLASSGAVWDDTVSSFKGSYRLHVVNLSGFAGEPAGANATGDILPPTVEALDGYIKANHLQKPVIVGHSMGGLLGLMLAKAHPEDAGKLVIVDALPFVGIIYNPAATADGLKPTATAMRDGMIAASVEAFQAQQAGGTAQLVTSPENQKRTLDWSLASDRRVLAQSFYEDLTTDLQADVSGIKTPTVVLYPVDPAMGQTAENTLPVYQQSYKGMPNVTFVRIDNSRHFIMLDQPQGFKAALGTALAATVNP